MAKAWFSFTGSDPVDPSHYTLGTPSCTTGADEICGIFAENVGSQPELDEEIKDQMIRALNSRQDIPGEVSLRLETP